MSIQGSTGTGEAYFFRLLVIRFVYVFLYPGIGKESESDDAVQKLEANAPEEKRSDERAAQASHEVSFAGCCCIIKVTRKCNTFVLRHC